MQICANKVVSIAYTLSDAAGRTIDSSDTSDPLLYLHGFGNLIAGLERALEGKTSGEQLAVSIPPDEAYGQRREELVQSVPRELFESPEEIRPGMRFQAESEAGPQIVTVVDVQEESITVDANHPLAGETLNFDVTVVAVRDATAEELEHGHAHGPDHNH